MKPTALRLMILGDHKVGKSAVTVRFLTKRFIGEYNSCTDHVYRCSVRQENVTTDVEVLDTCSQVSPSEVGERKLRWADAIIIVYSVSHRPSFTTASQLLLSLIHSRSNGVGDLPILLLGNKRDLEHRREVGDEEGQQMARQYGCLHDEVSAAESAQGVTTAIINFLKLVRSQQQQRLAATTRRRGSLGSISKLLGAVFGKSDSVKDSQQDSSNNMVGQYGQCKASGPRRMSLSPVGRASNGLLTLDKRRQSMDGAYRHPCGRGV